MNRKHGAVLIHNGKIVAAAHNYRVANDTCDNYHAEFAVMAKVKFNKKILQNSILVVVSIRPPKSKLNHLKISKPCCMCQKKIIEKRILVCYYSTDDSNY
jgi:tRNA(Arg) A34 adenosine deaminase TadA